MNLMTMKTKFSPGKALLCLCFIASAVSCEKAGGIPGTYRVEAVSPSGDAVRSALEGRDVVWTAKDVVACICHGDDPARFSVTKGIAPVSFSGRTATFEINATSGLQPRIIVNPSADGYGLDAAGNIRIPIPQVYESSVGTVSSKALISAGKIEDGTAFMKNVLSFLKFELEDDHTSKIRISAPGGEPLCGAVLFDSETLEAVGGGRDWMEVIPADGGAVFPRGIHYIPVPAGRYSSGLSVTVYRSDGSAATKSRTLPYALPRNKFIDMGKVSSWGLVFSSSEIRFEVVFFDGASALFPFSAAKDAAVADAIPAVAAVAGHGRVGPYYLVGAEQYPFYFNIQDTSGSKSYFNCQVNYGLRIGGTAGDYMAFPAVPGFRLASVHIEEGSKSARYTVTTDPSEGAPEYITEANVLISKNTTMTFTFTSDETQPGKSYRLATPTTAETSIKKLELTYEIVE